jgi:hypothetical protein
MPLSQTGRQTYRYGVPVPSFSQHQIQGNLTSRLIVHKQAGPNNLTFTLVIYMATAVAAVNAMRKGNAGKLCQTQPGLGIDTDNGCRATSTHKTVQHEQWDTTDTHPNWGPVGHVIERYPKKV